MSVNRFSSDQSAKFNERLQLRSRLIMDTIILQIFIVGSTDYGGGSSAGDDAPGAARESLPADQPHSPIDWNRSGR